MSISVFDLFSIGIGPSSSHTIGPMRAANRFTASLHEGGSIASVARIKVDLYGSLGATGKGHGSDKAVLLGLEGSTSEDVDVDAIADRIDQIRVSKSLDLFEAQKISFDETKDLIMHRRKTLSHHSNGMTFTAFDESGGELLARTYFSVGGGFVVNEDAFGADRIVEDETKLPYPFSSGDELLALCKQHQLSISDLMLENEKAWRSEAEVRAGLLHIWSVMSACVKRGCEQTGIYRAD